MHPIDRMGGEMGKGLVQISERGGSFNCSMLTEIAKRFGSNMTGWGRPYSISARTVSELVLRKSSNRECGTYVTRSFWFGSNGAVSGPTIGLSCDDEIIRGCFCSSGLTPGIYFTSKSGFSNLFSLTSQADESSPSLLHCAAESGNSPN